ncbi:cation:proton antiporter [Alicyclobacillus fastidiosus]|uniref:Cation:proton antiporter n=1 Tax=Alicyclobacillus fastidiosus TaxID=392011 RepID=A0ABV5AE14_9BACL|nr:cation:proton antiporter [Alicyclobacillus fastidiosus]WEH11221.1 cation:proton antiporter [Alicyclobacillus fastidiosus]
MSDTLFVFLLILAASFVFSTSLSRIPLLRIPSTVGYLLFGVLLQSPRLHITGTEVDWLNHLADFGLLFLMYISGMEIDIRQLRSVGGSSSTLATGLSIFCGTLLLSFGISLWLCHLTPPPTNPYMLALLFSTTSLGVILPILEETGLLKSPFGQTLLVSALLADFLTMFLLSLFISIQISGSLIRVLLTCAIVPFTILLYGLLRGVQRLPALRRLAGDVQARIRAIVALVSVTAALADFTGAEPILGSFLVGMLVSSLPFSFKDTLRDYSHGIGYGFFIPLFFISVGLDFDFRSVLSHETIVWIPVLILVAFAVKLIPSLHLVRQFGWRRAVAGGFLLSARLSLIAAAAQIGVQIGTMPQMFADCIILVAVFTSMLSPIAFVTVTRQRSANSSL